MLVKSGQGDPSYLGAFTCERTAIDRTNTSVIRSCFLTSSHQQLLARPQKFSNSWDAPTPHSRDQQHYPGRSTSHFNCTILFDKSSTKPVKLQLVNSTEACKRGTTPRSHGFARITHHWLSSPCHHSKHACKKKSVGFEPRATKIASERHSLCRIQLWWSYRRIPIFSFTNSELLH